MAEKELTESSNKKHVRQPPSVPFLWEERPGIPKRDWKPGVSSNSSLPTRPVKLIASIPFVWEETPGKPLPSFPQPPLETEPPIPPAYSNSYNDDGDERERIFESDLETFSFETDNSFSSVPTLLANCLVSSTAISTAVPVQKISEEEEDKSSQTETPSSPASETARSTSSYATGTSSLAGASFLEYLFPLLPPGSSFLEKVEHSENNSLAPLEPKSTHYDRESNSSVVVRRPPTLGELIMMSRRRSYRRKAVQMRKQNLSMELMENGAFGCWIFKSGSKMIEGLYRKGKHLPLKLV